MFQADFVWWLQFLHSGFGFMTSTPVLGSQDDLISVSGVPTVVF